MKNILVAIDLAYKNQELVDKAYQLAKAFNSNITFVHIAAPEPDFVGYAAGPESVRDARFHELKHEHQEIQEYAAKMNERGIEAKGLLIQGMTINTLLKEAEKLECDLIIAGHHHHGIFYRMIAGDTAVSVVKKAKIPVLVVPIEE